MGEKRAARLRSESSSPIIRKSEAASTLADLSVVKYSYQVTRRPICWLRIGEEMSEILPALPFPGLTLLSGFAQFATFNALNTSQRNWSFRFSLIWKFLSKAQSAVNKPGPRSELRLALPNVKAAGWAYAVGLNQQLTE